MINSNLKTKNRPEMRLSASLLEKYSLNIPRYTSYPTAPEWTDLFKVEDFLRANNLANKNKTPISLYFHLPFCERQCYFCACNVVISKQKGIVKPYLEYLKRETKNLSKLIDQNRQVEQIHLGGGTPTYFSPIELSDLYGHMKENFNISRNCEVGVEIDPRVTTNEHIKTLSSLGFNRLSMGIQDFDPEVQKAINRIQTFEKTSEILKIARDIRFESINIDLVYGLPYQTKDSFSRTIDLILKLNPDRIALFHYAHLPQLLPHQAKYIPNEALPSSLEKIKILQFAVQTLSENGYVFIGLDHFAKANDELETARRNKTLHRNFQGYTTKAGCDLYGLGITAISNIQDIFSQNIKKLNPYYEKLDSNEVPIIRGITLNKDDKLRREIIMKVLCHGEVVKSEIEQKYEINFNSYFSCELKILEELEKDGLVLLFPNSASSPQLSPCSPIIKVTSLGKFFLRNIASVFDYYLQRKNGKQRIYSKTI